MLLKYIFFSPTHVGGLGPRSLVSTKIKRYLNQLIAAHDCQDALRNCNALDRETLLMPATKEDADLVCPDCHQGYQLLK